MGQQPKDYDVFVLGRSQPDKHAIAASVHLPYAEHWHKSEPYLAGTYHIGEKIVQIMESPYPTLDELVDSFDWNVCLFGFDGSGVVKRMPVAEIGPGHQLNLNRVTFPLSTLRRGFRFSERFGMHMNLAVVKSLCAHVISMKGPGAGAMKTWIKSEARSIEIEEQREVAHEQWM